MNKKKLFNFSNQETFSMLLILLLVSFRIIPHPPNFTPIIAVAIMSSHLFKNSYLSVAVLLIAMVVSDLFIGFYKNFIFVYSALSLIVFIFFKINKNINYKNLFIFSIFGSLIFFLVSNFGVWLLGNLYEKNLKGLLDCYVMAIPFFRNTLLSTIVYCYGFYFSTYSLLNYLKK